MSTKYLRKQGQTWNFRKRNIKALRESTVTHELLDLRAEFLRLSLKTDSLKLAQKRRDALLVELNQLEDKAVNGAPDSFTELLAGLRADRDSKHSDMGAISPDMVGREDDPLYCDAYRVAVNEVIPTVSSEIAVRNILKRHDISPVKAVEQFLADNPNLTSKQNFTVIPSFLGELGKKPLSAITRDEVRELLSSTKLRLNTVQNRVWKLNRCIKHAQLEGRYNGSNPFEGHKMANIVQEKEKQASVPIPVDLWKKCLEDTEGFTDWRYAFPRLLPLTGLRIGELLRVRKSDIRDNVLFVQGGKTKAAARAIPLCEQAVEVINKLQSSTDYICQYSTKASVQSYILDNKAKRWGWGLGHSAHSFRKMFSTAMVEVGIPLDDRKVLMGHKGGSVTDDTYVVAPDLIERHSEQLSKLKDSSILSPLV